MSRVAPAPHLELQAPFQLDTHPDATSSTSLPSGTTPPAEATRNSSVTGRANHQQCDWQAIIGIRHVITESGQRQRRDEPSTGEDQMHRDRT